MMNRKSFAKNVSLSIVLLMAIFVINGCTALGNGNSNSADGHSPASASASATLSAGKGLP